jgi:hypothetical protein
MVAELRLSNRSFFYSKSGARFFSCIKGLAERMRRQVTVKGARVCEEVLVYPILLWLRSPTLV